MDIEKKIAQAIRTYFVGDMMAETVARAALAAMLEAVGEPVAYSQSLRGVTRELAFQKLTESERLAGWTETPLYSLAALREEL